MITIESDTKRSKEPNYKIPMTICSLKFNDPDLSFNDWECDRPIKRCIWCPIPDRYETPKTPLEETKNQSSYSTVIKCSCVTCVHRGTYYCPFYQCNPSWDDIYCSVWEEIPYDHSQPKITEEE